MTFSLFFVIVWPVREGGVGLFDNKELIDTAHAKGDYLHFLQKAREAGECPFCPGSINKGNFIVLSTGDWAAIENKWPYTNAAVHLVLIPRSHFTSLAQVKSKDWRAIGELIQLAQEKYPVLGRGGGLALRFGINSGVTIKHLHFHLIAPEGNGVVNFPIG